jgi:hypothetical protein
MKNSERAVTKHRATNKHNRVAIELCLITYNTDGIAQIILNDHITLIITPLHAATQTDVAGRTSATV